MADTVKNITVSARITRSMNTQLERATDRKRDPFAPTLSQIITRGIELALKELEKKGRS